MEKVGAVIVFEAKMTRPEVEAILKRLAERGVVESYTTQRFNPEHGEPVFYIP